MHVRDTKPLEPMWECDESPSLPARVLVGVASVASFVLRSAAPQAFRFASGQHPAVHFSWGTKEYRLGREGLQTRRRAEGGWEDNPRSNYSAAVEKKQARATKRGR